MMLIHSMLMVPKRLSTAGHIQSHQNGVSAMNP